ncbi:MAG TPA: SMP-30/gluconolactonase/LRE family protein [Gemmatimonadaceae bacterium]|nr:SMP-30/gluconolactonase/LRE family protein [Gemmatimonadaceae bacterium]
MTRPTAWPLTLALIVALIVAPSACTSKAAKNNSAPQRISIVEGLAQPEALSFDASQNVYFVSNVNGSPGVKDGNGFISRISADGAMDSLHFIQGGRDGVQLDAPMGSRVQGDTLWVLDVDKLRGFDTKSGKPYITVDLSPLKALFLNDLAIDSTGEFYITDTGVLVAANGMDSHPGPDRILHVAHDRSISVAASTALFSSPDGIAWDQRAKRFILAPFAGPSVQEWRIGDAGPKDIAQGKGMFDGVEVERDGTILITSWNDSSVSTLEGQKLVPRITKLGYQPADVSMDAGRSRVGIVSLVANRFELWEWPSTR